LEGVVLPIGGPKGSGIAMMMDILVACCLVLHFLEMWSI
jgi:LDH2 family malate/lactate/ureidoglycolate dehydrogenase